MIKNCLWCGEEFFDNTRRQNKIFCEKEHGRKYWRKNNPEKVKEQNRISKENRLKNPNSVLKMKIWKQNYDKTILRRFARYTSGAKQRGYNFEINIEQFENIVNKPCYYCGEKHEIMGVDRKDNNIGYIIENCVSCCTLCNMMKNKFGETEFISQCNKISKIHNI